MELRDRRMILLDVETTGFDCEKNQLLEVGMLVIYQMEVVAKLELKIRHNAYFVTPSAIKANDIDIIKHDEEGITTKEAAEEILKFVEEVKGDSSERILLIGQNIDFDIKFIENLMMKEYKIKEFRKFVGYRKLDIMQVALLKNIEGKVRVEKQDLDHLLKQLDIDIKDNVRHSAIGDCYLEWEVLNKLLGL